MRKPKPAEKLAVLELAATVASECGDAIDKEAPCIVTRLASHLQGEWCHDADDVECYRRREARGPDTMALVRSGARVGRGGGWWYPAWGCRSAYRWGLGPGGEWHVRGLRPARPLP